MNKELLYKDLTEKIISVIMKIHSTLKNDEININIYIMQCI